MNMTFKKQLAVPMEIKEMYPLTGKMGDVIDERRAQIVSVLEGRSDKLLLIIGPCSADREDSVLDYILRLCELQEKVKDTLLIVPRVYTNKPRTMGEGYMGMLHQPDPSAEDDMFKGIVAIRKMHLRVVSETGFVCADEMLYADNHQYLEDLLGYVAVGARSVEDQQHRLVASGVDIPVGMKNPTSGDYNVMMNAIYAAQHPHTFIYRGWEVQSGGNKHVHAILRGSTNKHGQHLQNYHYEDLIRLCDFYDERELSNPAVIIDCNHSNSGKDPFEQPRIIKDVLNSAKHSERITKILKGFMVESYIEDGNQPVNGGCYGKSITDACLGWKKTEELVTSVHEFLMHMKS